MSGHLFHRIYYAIKPLTPSRLRIAMRGALARRRRSGVADTWPILPGSELPPPAWPGWPDGKQFAFVLTHDVERQGGYDNCRRLMDLEMEMGYRSSFNFVPDGEYTLSEEFRAELVRNGFEVGVHDLHHDGSLLQNRRSFARQAIRINEALADWDCHGFRAGFMFHNLEWFHDLNIAYDASTFDTDPFEPQPDGVGTIFPFWVPNPSNLNPTPNLTRNPVPAPSTLNPQPSTSSTVLYPPSSGARRGGYVELPYTLAQDGTVFLLMREKTTELWERKLEWLATHGGMALLITHPDYMRFDGQAPRFDAFPARLYRDFLSYVKARYEGQMWHALPRDVAQHVRTHKAALEDSEVMRESSVTNDSKKPTSKVWIDLENTPHIPFFKPIIRELERHGCQVVLTARDAYQTCELAQKQGLRFRKIGRHYGKHKLNKVYGLFARSAQLVPFVLRERPHLALNHGSRTQNLVANLLRVPTVTLVDYEFSSALPMLRARWEIVPRVVGKDNPHGRGSEAILYYDGIKEDVYVPDFRPDSSILAQLELPPGDVLVTVRPPATEAHYHNPESEILFVRFMERVCQTPGVRAVVLPRNVNQENEIRTRWPHWFADGRVVIPKEVLDGLNLLWHSDLVVSGGGTMNREAAALGVPVYSIFRGRIGAVDRHLKAEGRLVLIENVSEVDGKIHFRPMPKAPSETFARNGTLDQVVSHVEQILKCYLKE